MVDHLLVYHPGLQRVKQMIDAGDLGQIYYLYGNRQNLGIVRPDENALWSLGPHDISVLLWLVGERPIDVAATGESYLQPGVEDVVFAIEVHNVNEVGVGPDEAPHELLERLAKEDAVEIALLEAHGVVAEKVEGRDDLHSSELAY